MRPAVLATTTMVWKTDAWAGDMEAQLDSGGKVGIGG